MTNLWLDLASDVSEADCDFGRWGQVAYKLTIAYVVLAGLSCAELRFRRHAVDVEAKVEIAGNGPDNFVWVRYYFLDPTTGKSRMNTELIPEERAPAATGAIVEFIPGEFSSSRLKSEARIQLPSIFFCVNSAFVVLIAGLIGYVAWEANHPVKQKRRYRIPYHRSSSPKRWTVS